MKRRCEATKTDGRVCLQDAQPGGRFCRTHADRLDKKKLTIVGACTAIGHAVMPWVGGLVGTGVGLILDWVSLDDSDKKPRVFVSFDFDHDQALKHFLIAQARLPKAPFAIVDCSLQEAAPEAAWEDKARRGIRSSDIVVVVVGRYTHKARGVLKEVRMAREENVKIVQVIGYSGASPTPVVGAGKLYRWSWDNLATLLG